MKDVVRWEIFTSYPRFQTSWCKPIYTGRFLFYTENMFQRTLRKGKRVADTKAKADLVDEGGVHKEFEI